MPGSEILFDTNAFIAWIAQDAGLARVALGLGEPAITLISVGELYFGALRSSRPEENLASFRERLRDFRLILPSTETADFYARTCMGLRRKGRPIPDNDLWIAALALQCGLPLLTRDRHFAHVDELRIVSW